MASDRIKKRPDELRDQLLQAAAAIADFIAGGGIWPANAPTEAECTAAANAIDTNITNINNFESGMAAERQSRDGNVDSGQDTVRGVDEATDSLFTPAGAEKVAFGLPPKGATPIQPLAKLTDIKTFDGLLAGSIRFDWENIQGATFEVKWFTDSALTQLVGSAVSTQSEMEISGLTPGVQYWMIVRPVRGGQFGPWSDPATRVANV